MSTSAERLRKKFAQGLQQLGLRAPEALLDKGMQYLALLQKWSLYGLVGPGSGKDWLSRHLLDSLSLLPFVAEVAARKSAATDSDGAALSLLDVGTGAGLPGLPLAMAMPELEVTLLDSRERSCIFVRQAAIELALSGVSVVCERVERLPAEPTWSLVTARAVADPWQLLPMLQPRVAPGGRLLLPCGPSSAEMFQHIAREPAPDGWASLQCKPIRVPDLAAERWLLIADKK